ncbi:hypothetical protein [Mycoplasmoides fastidiosum]|uniref:class III lanthionine synthetase LanKC N-terminal domain-containing protein n=1 Tax=Mycoplasmoides fastidiosum TaxID=92758 RepID=UPI002113CE8A|nr:hypothetical protein [Mycoplasmoides fastidiosum]UUD37425.1 hypothetical protein NPA10_02500 [Mycoplasmoides fastidiosum]
MFDYDIPSPAWKIHVSSNFYDYQKILDIVCSYCYFNKISFKFINNYQFFYQSIMESKKINNLTGKFITIYPIDESQARKIIKELHQSLSFFKAPSNYSDRQYKNGIVSYRYGDNYLDDEQKQKYQIIQKYKPDNIEDLFKKRELEIKYLCKDIIPIGLIKINAFGAIILAKNSNDKKYILKEAKKYMGNKNFNPIILRENERSIIRKFSKSNFFPREILKFKKKQSIFYVQDYIELPNLDYYANIKLLTIEKLEEKINFYNNLTKELKRFIYFLKENKIVINDISKSNFLYSERESKIYFVDLEYSAINNKILNFVHSEYEYKKFHNHKSNYQTDCNKIAMMILDMAFDIKNYIHYKKNNIQVFKFLKYIILNLNYFPEKQKMYLETINSILEIIDKKIGLNLKFDKNKLLKIYEQLSSYKSKTIKKR